MISGSNEQLQKQLEYTPLNYDCHSWWISKMQSWREEERYAITSRFKQKNAIVTYRKHRTAFGESCINRASVFEWHKRFKEGRESMSDDGSYGRNREVNTPELISQRVRVEVFREFRKRFPGKKPALFKSRQWHFHWDNALVHNSILVTDYLTKMAIKTVLHPPCSPDLAPCDFWLFPKLIGCRHETIKEMKVAVTKIIDTLIQEDFHGVFQKLFERHNKCIATGGDYFERE